VKVGKLATVILSGGSGGGAAGGGGDAGIVYDMGVVGVLQQPPLGLELDSVGGGFLLPVMFGGGEGGGDGGGGGGCCVDGGLGVEQHDSPDDSPLAEYAAEYAAGYNSMVTNKKPSNTRAAILLFIVLSTQLCVYRI
jgi:hypothetical protein